MASSPSYEQVNARILKFRDDRDWKQFHTIQSLIVSLAIEAGELLELTQWKDTGACQKLADSEDLRDECADVLLYLMELADCAGFDLLKAANDKLDKCDAKYPVDKARGTSKKYNQL